MLTVIFTRWFEEVLSLSFIDWRPERRWNRVEEIKFRQSYSKEWERELSRNKVTDF